MTTMNMTFLTARMEERKPQPGDDDDDDDNQEKNTTTTNTKKTHHKQRGLSPFRRHQTRSQSPIAVNQKNHHHKKKHSKSKSPLRFPRSLSPFRRHHHHHSNSPQSPDNRKKNNGADNPTTITSSDGNTDTALLTNNSSHHSHSGHAGITKKPNVLICRESARSIVFRDHLRLARKIIQEVAEEDEDDSDDEDDENENDDENHHESELAFQTLQKSLRESIRASFRESTSTNSASGGRNGSHRMMTTTTTTTGSNSGNSGGMGVEVVTGITGSGASGGGGGGGILSSFSETNTIISKEINALAQSLVPELTIAGSSGSSGPMNDATSFFETASHVSERSVEIEGLHATHITPLEELEWNSKTIFWPLLGNHNNKEKDEKEQHEQHKVEEEEEGDDGDLNPRMMIVDHAHNYSHDEMKDWSFEEQEIYKLLQEQRACVKTVKNSEWPSFLQRFHTPSLNMNHSNTKRGYTHHDDIPPIRNKQQTGRKEKDGDGYPLNSFMTSTTILPAGGYKMRSYGSLHAYTVGVVFALPKFTTPQLEIDSATVTHTWCWPAGYAAKTEFNIDHRTGRLMNGREEALVSLPQLRNYNHDYLTKTDHYIAGKIIQGGFKIVPYNELYIRVGGPHPTIDDDHEEEEEEYKNNDNGTMTTTNNRCRRRSFKHGIGLFQALFLRSASMGDIITLFRTRARIANLLADGHDDDDLQLRHYILHDLPLLFIHPEFGVRVFTKSLQQQFWYEASHKLQPFPNPTLAPTIRYDDTNETSLQQKLQELLSLEENTNATNANNKKKKSSTFSSLTHNEIARIAGGFGITDQCFSNLLCHHSGHSNNDKQHHEEHDIMQEALAFAIRSGDHYTARQLLILYYYHHSTPATGTTTTKNNNNKTILLPEPASTYSNLSLLETPMTEPTKTPTTQQSATLPPPIDTKKLRRATNSDGLLLVLGATQILKMITTGHAKRRTEESFEVVEEWVKLGQESVSFRLASWREQRADEAGSNLAMSNDSKFLAFVTNKSVTNRRKFSQHLRKAVGQSSSSSSSSSSLSSVGMSNSKNDDPHYHHDHVRLLQVMNEIVDSMHSPCMRLELLQYILGLDNRYSVSLIKESIELAATCFSFFS